MLQNLIKISDCTKEDLEKIIKLGIEFKKGKRSDSLSGKTAVLLLILSH